MFHKNQTNNLLRLLGRCCIDSGFTTYQNPKITKVGDMPVNFDTFLGNLAGVSDLQVANTFLEVCTQEAEFDFEAKHLARLGTLEEQDVVVPSFSRVRLLVLNGWPFPYSKCYASVQRAFDPSSTVFYPT